jgi:hypothetical protein
MKAILLKELFISKRNIVSTICELFLPILLTIALCSITMLDPVKVVDINECMPMQASFITQGNSLLPIPYNATGQLISTLDTQHFVAVLGNQKSAIADKIMASIGKQYCKEFENSKALEDYMNDKANNDTSLLLAFMIEEHPANYSINIYLEQMIAPDVGPNYVNELELYIFI